MPRASAIGYTRPGNMKLKERLGCIFARRARTNMLTVTNERKRGNSRVPKKDVHWPRGALERDGNTDWRGQTCMHQTYAGARDKTTTRKEQTHHLDEERAHTVVVLHAPLNLLRHPIHSCLVVVDWQLGFRLERVADGGLQTCGEVFCEYRDLGYVLEDCSDVLL